MGVQRSAGDKGTVLGSIEKVPGKRMPYVCHMDPNLVCAARLQLQPEQGAAAGSTYRLIVGAGPFSIRADLLGHKGTGQWANRCVYHTSLWLGNPFAHREVDPAKIGGVELSFQALLGVGVFGHHQ